MRVGFRVPFPYACRVGLHYDRNNCRMLVWVVTRLDQAAEMGCLWPADIEATGPTNYDSPELGYARDSRE